LESWAQDHYIALAHIQPGKPAHTVPVSFRENAYIERFNRTFREDVLDPYLFSSLEEVRQIVEPWIEEYNAVRPHAALRGMSPYQFAAHNA
jgi:putative transposase